MTDTIMLQPIRVRVGTGTKTPIRLSMPQQLLRINLTNPTTSGQDKHYEAPFNGAEVLNIQHNLNKKPAVTIIDSAGDEVEAQVEHVDNDNLIVTMSAANSGVVVCN